MGLIDFPDDWYSLFREFVCDGISPEHSIIDFPWIDIGLALTDVDIGEDVIDNGISRNRVVFEVIKERIVIDGGDRVAGKEGEEGDGHESEDCEDCQVLNQEQNVLVSRVNQAAHIFLLYAKNTINFNKSLAEFNKNKPKSSKLMKNCPQSIQRSAFLIVVAH